MSIFAPDSPYRPNDVVAAEAVQVLCRRAFAEAHALTPAQYDLIQVYPGIRRKQISGLYIVYVAVATESEEAFTAQEDVSATFDIVVYSPRYMDAIKMLAYTVGTIQGSGHLIEYTPREDGVDQDNLNHYVTSRTVTLEYVGLEALLEQGEYLPFRTGG